MLIYTPKGKAREYIPDGYALNLYKGCVFGCTYCYVPQISKVDRMFYYDNPNPKKDIISKLRKELPKYKGKKIFMSFIGDIYQPDALCYDTTHQVLLMMKQHDITPVILTKGIVPASHWQTLADFNELWFGATITENTPIDAQFEPLAPPNFLRLRQLEFAKSLISLKTWISIEPFFNPEQVVQIVNLTSDFIDHYKIGIANYVGAEYNTDELKEMVDYLRNTGKDIYFKQSLMEKIA